MAKQMKHKPKAKKKRVGRKKFFDVAIPLTASKVSVFGYTPEDVSGGHVKVDLTRSMRGKNLELTAKINLKDEKLVGEIKSVRILPTHIKRSMRRGCDYVEDSFEATTKESVVRIKPFMISRKRISRAVRRALRNTAKKHLEGKLKILKTEELFSQVMTNKLQKEMSLKLKKVYPLALCEIRVLEVLRPVEKVAKETDTTDKKE